MTLLYVHNLLTVETVWNVFFPFRTSSRLPKCSMGLSSNGAPFSLVFCK